MITLFNIRPRALNIGNDIIAIGTRMFINEAFQQVVNIVSLPATSKYESHNKAGLGAQTIHEMNQYGHGVIVGGGNLYENGELELNLDALGALEPPLMLFSLSRGRIYGRQGKLVQRTDAMPDRIALAINRKAALSLARDRATLDYLHGIGAASSVLGGCPTLFLDSIAQQFVDYSDQYRNTVLLSIRTPQLMNIPLERQSEVRNDVLGIIELLRKRGHDDIRLVCHDYRDIAFAATFKSLDYLYVEDAFTFLSILKSCALNVTYRLHSALPCFSFGCPCIVISYDERANSTFNTIGFGGWNIDMVKEDVIAAVADRYDRLNELPHIRSEAQPVWHALRTVMNDSFADFASRVVAFSHL